MILVCGIPTESPVELVIDALTDAGAPLVVLNQRSFDDIELTYDVSAGGAVDGLLSIGRRQWPLRDVAGVYTRLMDDQQLPELASEPEGSPRRRACRSLHQALATFCDVTPAKVLNRTGPMSSNASKPFQAQVIARHGFDIPETIITNDPDQVRRFVAEFGRVVYKSVSGIRSIVETITADDLGRLDQIRWCPVQFQAYVPGVDIRVHTVGDAVFATEVQSKATDYRYATRQVDMAAALRPCELDDETARRCVALAEELGLPLAGIDLKRTETGETFCFEVNPSPAFSYFEAHTGQPIAAAIAAYLRS